MSQQPIVSFIITYHNEPVNFVEQCIDSVLGLSLAEQEREIILVDDGSDRNLLQEMGTYLDKLLYLRQPASGLSVARNHALDVAKGKYIQFIDADDYLIRAPYEHDLDLVRYHQPDIVLFHNTDKEAVPTPFFLPEPVSGAEYMRHNNLRASACGYIFRRDILHGLRFTPQLLHEDEAFTPQLLLRCDRVFATNDYSYYYRRHEGSITRKTDKRWNLRRLNDKENIIHQLNDKAAVLPPDEKAGLQRRVDQLIMDYLYDTIALTHSLHELESRISRLQQKGLFPLPDKKYTKKYDTFRRLIANKAGQRILLGYCILHDRLT